MTKIFLCGISPTPPTHEVVGAPTASVGAENKVAKTALGAEKSIPWEYHKQTWKLLHKLKSKNEKLKIVALEQMPKSKNIFEFKPEFPLALLVGNEISGLNKKILSYTDKIIEIPMHGQKESLNVAVATGIALYKLIEKNP